MDNELSSEDDVPIGSVNLASLSGMTGFGLKRAQMWVARDLKARFKPLDISLAQFSILYLVNANPGLSQVRIADALFIERARLVQMLDRLEGRQLLRRERSKSDRRSHALHLTAKGEDLLRQLLALHLDHERRLAEVIGEDGKAQLLRLLAPLQD